MIRLLPIILVIALAVSCLVDCAQSDKDRIRYLPKSLWMFLILIPVVGPLAWLLTGRPRQAGQAGPAASRRPVVRPAPPAPRAPDDDPDFLAQLDERRRLEHGDDERGTGPEPPENDPRKDEDPESHRDSGS